MLLFLHALLILGTAVSVIAYGGIGNEKALRYRSSDLSNYRGVCADSDALSESGAGCPRLIGAAVEAAERAAPFLPIRADDLVLAIFDWRRDTLWPVVDLAADSVQDQVGSDRCSRRPDAPVSKLLRID